jgi:hypothetical protein
MRARTQQNRSFERAPANAYRVHPYLPRLSSPPQNNSNEYGTTLDDVTLARLVVTTIDRQLCCRMKLYLHVFGRFRFVISSQPTLIKEFKRYTIIMAKNGLAPQLCFFCQLLKDLFTLVAHLFATSSPRTITTYRRTRCSRTDFRAKIIEVDDPRHNEQQRRQIALE